MASADAEVGRASSASERIPLPSEITHESMVALAKACGAAHEPVQVKPGVWAIDGPVPEVWRLDGLYIPGMTISMRCKDEGLVGIEQVFPVSIGMHLSSLERLIIGSRRAGLLVSYLNQTLNLLTAGHVMPPSRHLSAPAEIKRKDCAVCVSPDDALLGKAAEDRFTRISTLVNDPSKPFPKPQEAQLSRQLLQWPPHLAGQGLRVDEEALVRSGDSLLDLGDAWVSPEFAEELLLLTLPESLTSSINGRPYVKLRRYAAISILPAASGSQPPSPDHKPSSRGLARQFISRTK